MPCPRWGCDIVAVKPIWLVAVGVAVVAFAPQLEAATCSEEIDLLASQYALSTKLPESPSGAAGEAATPPGAQAPAGAAALPASKRRQMQVLLNGARAADQQGKEAECFERLSEARAIPEPG
ncbi:MAG TPA: hypothetical protein VHM01_06180 [Alphaproteobacteria bacterium]|nr:hypothetical protein [Alphaproteobacteria bacterium]